MPTAAERTATLRAGFPPPSVEKGWRLDAEIRLQGTPFGNARFELRPSDGSEGSRTWHVIETSRVHSGLQAKVLSTEAILAGDLSLVRMDRRRGEEGGETETLHVERADAGFSLERRAKAGAEPVRSVVPADRATTSTLAALFQLARLCPTEPATYELPVLLGDDGGIAAGRIEVRGPSRLEAEGAARDSWLVVATLGPDLVFELHLDPKDRTPLAAIQPRSGLVMIAKGLAKEPDAPPLDTAGPAHSPEEAGARFAIGLLTGDLDMIAAVVHWESLRAAAPPEAALADLPTYRAARLAELKASCKDLPRSHAEGLVRRAVSEASTSEVDGGIEVVFGPPLATFRYVAKLVDGAWLLVRLPTGR